MRWIVASAAWLAAFSFACAQEQCTVLPRCTDPGALADARRPFPLDYLGPQGQYRLHGNITHSARCIDNSYVPNAQQIASFGQYGVSANELRKAWTGCIFTRNITIYDCYATRQGAPPGYCYSNTTIGLPVTTDLVEAPNYNFAEHRLIPCSCAH